MSEEIGTTNRLQELLHRPVEDWYAKKIIKPQEDLLPPAIGGHLVTSVFARRHRTKQLMELLGRLPEIILSYTEEEMKQYDGLIPEMQEVVLLAASLGRPRMGIAKLVGVNEKRLRKWIERGLQGDVRLGQFAYAITRIEEAADIEDENNLYEAAALELKTSGTYLSILKRKDEMRRNELELFEEIPIEEFTDDELAEYNISGRVPPRLSKKSNDPLVVSDQIIDEDHAFIRNLRLIQEIEILKRRNSQLAKELKEKTEDADSQENNY